MAGWRFEREKYRDGAGALSSRLRTSEVDGRSMGWDRRSVDGQRHFFHVSANNKCIQCAPPPLASRASFPSLPFPQAARPGPSRIASHRIAYGPPSYRSTGQPHHCCAHHTTTVPCSLATIPHSMPSTAGELLLIP